MAKGMGSKVSGLNPAMIAGKALGVVPGESKPAKIKVKDPGGWKLKREPRKDWIRDQLRKIRR